MTRVATNYAPSVSVRQRSDTLQGLVGVFEGMAVDEFVGEDEIWGLAR